MILIKVKITTTISNLKTSTKKMFINIFNNNNNIKSNRPKRELTMPKKQYDKSNNQRRLWNCVIKISNL